MPETTNTSIPAFKDYIQDRKYMKNVSPRTLAWYRDVERVFGAVDVHNIRPSLRLLIQVQLEKGIKPVSVNSWLTGIRAYLFWLHNEGHLKDRPRVELLKFEQKILSTFTVEDVMRLASWKPIGGNQTRVLALALTALDSGLRISELLGLNRQDVDFDHLTLKVKGKGNKQRLVPMSLELRKVLFRYLTKHNHARVFATRTGTQLRARNADRDFKVLCNKVGITGVRLSFHTLRHSFAVGYLRRGGNLEFLRRILGHTSLSTTQKYLRSLGVEDLQAVHNELSLLAR